MTNYYIDLRERESFIVINNYQLQTFYVNIVNSTSDQQAIEISTYQIGSFQWH